MKYNINKIAILTLVTVLGLSCESDDKIVDTILEEVGTGAILRTIDETNNLV